ncbi:MAG: ATP-binding protein [Phascolarctobacterium sp.]|uniref:ATP-binding protein n=1 Tax=Phascolarctobacterium sp. TaxID=2049039 RepID=UPI0026DD2CB8|nr:ATP-binding protein [Phascolarctobacterium sp.]MDO4921826.1 ATP-binding protein [Phascolarctobacterium sp.]
MENLELLVKELCKHTEELPWLEFKYNNYTPDTIGEDISALANAAALEERNYAYFLWGVEDSTHKIIGTDYNLQNLKKGNQELENWLRGILSANADFEYHAVPVDGVIVGILIIHCAINNPVTFKKVEYIRVGSYTKKLIDYPALQARLWNRLHNRNFEEMTARQDMNLIDALALVNYNTYFDLMNLVQPDSREQIAHYLIEEDCIIRNDSGLYDITNMGAVLLAKNLSDFSRIVRKAIRVVQYEGTNRLNMLKEEIFKNGYACDFENLLKYIESLTPTREIINENGLREKKVSYPNLAIREAVANALIHQDFSISGTGPTVEIFANRIEIINSGVPLVDIRRIVDNPPKSRNEKLASLMRRLKICEELGTGWDKIVTACELAQLPAPKIELYEESTKVTLYAAVNFSSLSLEDKLWAAYLHACIMHIQGEQLTNSSLRKRFGLPVTSAGSISRLIKEAVKRNIIKPLDPSTSNKYMRYVPVWA